MSPLPKLNLQDVKAAGPAAAFVGGGEDNETPEAPVEAPVNAPARPGRRPTTRPTTRAVAKPATDAAAGDEQTSKASRVAFYGAGTVEQTSIAIEPHLYQTLTDIARAARVPSNTLFLAAVHASLPATTADAVKAIVEERASYPGRRREYTPRVPLALRARIDELVATAREHVTKATRADLVNPSLRDGLPSDAHDAAELVAAWERDRELSQLPPEYDRAA